ncbi:MAG: TAT-variant-translocated molybdopterin oxidoreductase [Gemmataceae bacterium]
MKRPPIDPELLRDRLAEAQGKRYWQSIEELAEDPRLHEMIQREFPQDASVWTDPVSRRRFLSLMGASLALAGFASSGCRPPTGKIMPYVKQPENLTPGKPLYYATASTEGGFLTGLLVESHEGRPTKIEGNPKHVASRGATTVHQQASILGMYDPDRSHSVVFREQFRAWVDVLEELRGRLNSRPGGKGVAILGELIGSPTLLAQKEAFLKAYPQAQWFTFDPLNCDNAVAGAKLAFNKKAYHSYYKLSPADVIVALQSDFLNEGPGCLDYTRQFSNRRREGGTERSMNRLYAFETDLTVTGSRADHRFAIRPSQVEAVAWHLAFKVGVPGLVEKNLPKLDEGTAQYVNAVAKDLKLQGKNPREDGTTAVLAGEGVSPAVHALVHAINEKLGNFNKTVFFIEPLPGFAQNSKESLDKLIHDIEKGVVDTLIILGGNPAYSAPADLSFASTLQASLKKPREKWLSVRLGTYYDETSRLCHWHVPQSHYLEQWGDGIAYNGAACIVQPLIAPLYASKSLHEFLGDLTPVDPKAPTYETQSIDQVLQAYWKKNLPKSVKGSFEDYWQTSLHDGILADTRPATVTPKVTLNLSDKEMQQGTGVELGDKSFELLLTLDPAVVDGRFANNAWLQEWPKPTTRISWDNALHMSPATAAKLNLIQHPDQQRGGEHGNTVAGVVQIKIKGEKRTLDDVPIWIVPGHADGAVTLQLGYGRDRAGKVGSKVGVNAYRLRTSHSPWTQIVEISPVRGKTHHIACQQGHHSMEGRDIVRSGTAEEYRKDPNFIHKHGHGGHGTKPLPTLYDGKDHPYDGYKWGMAVNLSACTGCGACVVACQAENNIPVVGKTEVMRGREMHWLRIDRYFETAADHGHGHGKEKDKGSKATEHAAPLHVHYQPVMCQHCENAPCELVCPVEATAHGDEGTNDMVYNRCVGTRYCANNCPYKVRRFNFLQYTDYHTPSLRLMYNPDVTVRTRGVMEKCTFCIQRISYARIEAAKEALDGNPKRVDPHKRKVQGKDVAYIKDGEVVTACQASCAADAIIFGDLNDPDSKVAKLAKSHLRYDLLGELGVNPRTFYLASIRNPNPELETK